MQFLVNIEECKEDIGFAGSETFSVSAYHSIISVLFTAFSVFWMKTMIILCLYGTTEVSGNRKEVMELKKMVVNEKSGQWTALKRQILKTYKAQPHTS